MSKMQSTYPLTDWKDFPDTSTPLTADKLNQIESYLDHAYTIAYALNKDWGQTETQVKDLLRYMDDARKRLKDVELNDAETSTKIKKILSDIETLTKGLESQASLIKALDRWKSQHSEQFKDLLTGYTELEELAAKTSNDLNLLTSGVNIPSWLQDLRDVSSKMEFQLNTLLDDFDKLETSHSSLEDSHKVLEDSTEALSELVQDLDEAFSFKGNNLIQNGWDEFEAYGAVGKEIDAPKNVFEEGYYKNEVMNGHFHFHDYFWDLSSEGDSEINTGGAGAILTIGEKELAHLTQKYEGNKEDVYYLTADVDNPHEDGSIGLWLANGGPQGQYRVEYCRVSKTDGYEKYSLISQGEPFDRILFGTTTYKDFKREVRVNKIMLINLSRVYGKGKEPSKEWCDENIVSFEPHWVEYSLDERVVPAWDNMAVLKTPLGNGLTRIQTWGGNDEIKLYQTTSVPYGVTKTYSLFVKNLTEEPMIIRDGARIGIEKVGPKESKFVSFISDYTGHGFRFLANSVESNLDFIASDPFIVEGEEPGLMEITKDNIAKEVSVARYWNLENMVKVLGLEDKFKEIESKLENPFDEDEKEQIINDVKEEIIAAIGDINFDDMENALSILEESLATKASQTELNEALATKIGHKELNEALAKKIGQNELNEAVANIEKILETHATKKNLTDSVNKLEVQINQLGEGLEAKIKDIVDGSSAEGIVELQGELKALKGRVDALGTVVKDEDFQAALTKLNKDIGSKASKEDLNSKVSALENNLSTRVTTAELNTAVTGVKKELDGSITALNVGGLKSSLDQLQKDHSALSSKVNGFNFADKADVDLKVNGLKSSLASLQKDHTTLKNKVDGFNFADKGDVDLKVNELKTSLATIQKDLTALSNKVNGFNFADKADVDSLNSKVSELTSKVSGVEGKISLIEFSIRSFDKSVKELEENVSGLENTVKGALTSSSFKEVSSGVPPRQGHESTLTVPSGFGPYPYIISVMHTQPNNGGIRVPAGKDFSYWLSSDGKKIHYKPESSDSTGGRVWFLLMKPF